MTCRGDRAGIILILVSAMVTLLMLLSLLILGVSRSMGMHAAARGEALRHRLGAASGADYAAARLSRDAMPRFTPTAADRGDDWTFRDAGSADPSAALNPSYSHGEGWDDSGTTDGVYAGADPRGPDRDGDGRFSAWSGRLRGGRGGAGLRFALQVECLDGRIPLNAGWLWLGDGIDNNGNGVVDEPGEPDGVDNNLNGTIDEAGECIDFDSAPETWPNWRCGKGDGVPDYNQLHVPYHASLAFVLNNLAARLHHPASGLPLVSTRCWDIPSGADTTGDGIGDGDPLQAAWLGEDLIKSRPMGGYRTWADVERTLLNLNPAAFPGAPYTKAEVEAIRPYIDLGPYGLPSDSARASTGQTRRVTPYVPIHLAAAPAEVLEALWRYLSVDPFAYGVNTATSWPPAYQVVLQGDFPGEPAGFPAVCPWSGLRYFDTTDFNPPWGQFRLQRPVVYPAEAARLAQAAIGFRRGATLGWRELRRTLMEQSATIFLEDATALTAATPSPHALAGSWCSAKAELAFQAVCEDPTPTRTFLPSSVLATWGVDRDGNAGNGFQPAPTVPFERIQRVPYPWTGFTPSNPAPWPSFYGPQYGPGLPFWCGGGYLHPQGLTLSPPLRFRIVAASGKGGAEGAFFAGERLDFGSQEDFECLAGGVRLQGTGIETLDIPAASLRRGAPLGYAPAIVTLPRWNRRSLVSPTLPSPVIVPDALGPPLYGFSRTYGSIGLGTLEIGPGTAQLYWPLTEDFDPQNANHLAVPAWREFWSRVQAGSVPWPPPNGQPPYKLYPEVGAMALEDGGYGMMHPYGFTCGMGGSVWSPGLCKTGGGVHGW